MLYLLIVYSFKINYDLTGEENLIYLLAKEILTIRCRENWKHLSIELRVEIIGSQQMTLGM